MTYRTLFYTATATCAVLIATATCATRQARTYKAEAERQGRNVEALTEEASAYRLRDSLAAVRSEDLELTRRELERLRAEDAKLIEDMGVELRRLRSSTTVTTTATIEGRTPTKTEADTTTDGGGGAVYTAHAEDRWHRIDIEARRDTTHYRLSVRDSLAVVLYREPHRFLWWRWGTKRLTTTVASLCPYVREVEAKTITITTK
jgi:hypothetical protein